MQDIFIEFLPPWVETNLQPAFYDSESGTVLQQTARMYGKINEIIKSVNGMEKTIKEFVDYINNYFDNLDVQEEINTKLDDMAESGELSEIIATYLEIKSMLAYNTPSDLKSATNLLEGSFAKTYGYKRADDGVYDFYKVRATEEGDVDDGYNTIILTADPTLVAIRLQPGLKRVIKLKSSDNIQDYLSLEGEKEITLPAGLTLTYNDALLLNSDTTIDLNGATLNFSFDRSSIFDYDWDETLGFMGYGPDDTFTGYSGYKNITIKNGSIVGGCSNFMHNKNVTFENVYFQTAGGRHSLQLAGCNGFTVKNCTFEGARDDETSNASELINIDFCIYGGQPYISQYSVMYDDTKNMNVLVESNTFKQTNSANMGYFSAVGTHGNSTSTDTVCENIIIRGNNFANPREYAIGLKNYVNVTIVDNLLDDSSDTYNPHFIYKRGLVNGAIICNNNTIGINKFFESANPTYKGANINISSNNIIAKDGNYDSSAVFMLLNIHDSVLSGNNIQYQHHPIHINTRAYYDSVEDDPNDHTINLTIENNTFTKTVNSAVYFGSRISTCDGVKFTNNSFVHLGTLQSNWYDFLYQGTQTNLIMQGNTSDAPLSFIPIAVVNTKFSGNNALYLQSSGMSSSSTTGTFNKNITNFSKILLNVGETTNSQVLEFFPYYPNGSKIDSPRTFKRAVPKNDGTYGVASFAISNDGADWSYTGDIPLRLILAQD